MKKIKDRFLIFFANILTALLITIRRFWVVLIYAVIIYTFTHDAVNALYSAFLIKWLVKYMEILNHKKGRSI